MKPQVESRIYINDENWEYKKVKDELACYIKHEQIVSNTLQLKTGILFSLYRTAVCPSSF